METIELRKICILNVVTNLVRMLGILCARSIVTMYVSIHIKYIWYTLMDVKPIEYAFAIRRVSLLLFCFQSEIITQNEPTGEN